MSARAPAEGVIRFRYRLAPLSSPLDAALLQKLNAWRRVLRQTALIGETPERYDGNGFGNVSARERPGGATFVITASQTGRLATLQPEQFARITACDLERFEACAEGALPPSSETLTHAALYQAAPEVRWVLHGHSPHLFRAAHALGLPTTAADVEYGTAQMARAVAELVSPDAQAPLVFVSLGHEDGVFACGAEADAVGCALIAALAQSFALADAPVPP